jgi:hypothetical protein
VSSSRDLIAALKEVLDKKQLVLITKVLQQMKKTEIRKEDAAATEQLFLIFFGQTTQPSQAVKYSEKLDCLRKLSSYVSKAWQEQIKIYFTERQVQI